VARCYGSTAAAGSQSRKASRISRAHSVAQIPPNTAEFLTNGATTPRTQGDTDKVAGGPGFEPAISVSVSLIHASRDEDFLPVREPSHSRPLIRHVRNTAWRYQARASNWSMRRSALGCRLGLVRRLAATLGYSGLVTRQSAGGQRRTALPIWLLLSGSRQPYLGFPDPL
jgi:hypothetical protein